MPNRHGDIIWYELMSRDPDGAKTFYDAVVGWDIEPVPAGELDYRMIRRSDGGNAGGVLRLTGEMSSGGARPMWVSYINVDDVDASVEAIAKDGGQSWMAPTDIAGVGRIAMVADPQGAPFYVMRPMPPSDESDAVSDVFSADRPQRVRWNELATVDPDGAIRFYCDQFGWAQEGEMDMGDMGKYRFIESGGVAIGAVMRKPEQRPVSQWTYYFGVDDIDRGAAAIVSGGGQVFAGPMEIPGGEFAVVAMDPDGASFGLVGPRH